MLMQSNRIRHLPAAMLSIALICLCGPSDLSPQSAASAPLDPNSKTPTPAYEVVSIKPASPNERNVDWRPLPNGFNFNNLPLAPLLYQAYGITLDSQISGLPDWVKSDRYQVSARTSEETTQASKKLTKEQLSSLQQAMLQSLFADRFQLRMRREVRQLPVYNLVIAKSGLKMKDAAPDEKESNFRKTLAYYGDNGPVGGRTITDTVTAGTTLGLAQTLASYAGRVIVDKTGLGDKRFDFELKWSTDGEFPDPAKEGPPIFKALEEQLGLKLEPAKEPVDIFFVEHIEHPSQN